MADVILKTISIKQKMVNFKKHLLIVLLTSRTLYCHQYSSDFIYFVLLARELFLHSWLTFRENGPNSYNIFALLTGMYREVLMIKFRCTVKDSFLIIVDLMFLSVLRIQLACIIMQFALKMVGV